MTFDVEYKVRERKNRAMDSISIVTKLTLGWYNFIRFYDIEKGDLTTFGKIDQ